MIFVGVVRVTFVRVMRVTFVRVVGVIVRVVKVMYVMV